MWKAGGKIELVLSRVVRICCLLWDGVGVEVCELSKEMRWLARWYQATVAALGRRKLVVRSSLARSFGATSILYLCIGLCDVLQEIAPSMRKVCRIRWFLVGAFPNLG